MPRRLSITLAAVLLAACSGGSTPPAPPTTSTAAPSSTTPGPTPTPPALPDAAKQPTPAGAEAFFSYFWDVYNYSFKSGDSGPLREISESQCNFCADAARKAADGQSAGLKYLGGAVTVGAVVAAPSEPGKAILVSGQISQDPGVVYGPSNSPVASISSRPARRADGLFVWRDGAWRTLGIQTQVQ